MAQVPWGIALPEPEPTRDDFTYTGPYREDAVVAGGAPNRSAPSPTRAPANPTRTAGTQQNPNLDPIPAPNYGIELSAPMVLKPPVQKNSLGIEIKDPPKEKATTPPPAKSGTGKATPPQAPVVPPKSAMTEPYKQTAPAEQQAQDPQEFSPATAGWFDKGAEEETAPQAPATDPHRSLLGALMGWDDIPYGKKWNHYLQHGFVGVSQQNVDNVTKMAQMENKGGLAGPGATYGQELRAKETKRRTLMNQWDKLLADWNAGRYAGDEQSLNWFYGVANNLRNELAAEGINPNTLRPPSINAGGFAQGFQKYLADDREKLDWLGSWMEQIQQHASQDPNWLNSTAAQAEFDKLSEYVIINWAQSKGAIADAEKVRAQVEAMPKQDRIVFDAFMRNFFDANTLAQVNALAAAGDYSALQTVESFNQLMGMVDRGEPLSKFDKKTGRFTQSDGVSYWLDALTDGYVNLIKNQANIPINIQAAVSSYKNSRDSFLEYTMQNANVDRQAVWDMAMDQLGMYQSKYNSKLPKLGLQWGWGYTPRKVDRGFGDYLKNWQSQVPTSGVMQNARLAYGHVPKPVSTGVPFGVGKGGR